MQPVATAARSNRKVLGALESGEKVGERPPGLALKVFRALGEPSAALQRNRQATHAELAYERTCRGLGVCRVDLGHHAVGEYSAQAHDFLARHGMVFRAVGAVFSFHDRVLTALRCSLAHSQ